MDKADLKRIAREALRPADNGDPVEWAEKNVLAIPDSPMPGPFRSGRTPWIAEALRMIADPETRLVTVLASIQSGKSLLIRLFSCHAISNAPGPMMILQANDPEAKDFSLRYLRPLWKNCPPVMARLADADSDRSTTADFDRMTVYCRGIWNESNLQRLSLRYVIADECWLAPPGHLAEASARVTAFGWMGKRLFLSQGGVAGQEFHQLHEQSNQMTWAMACPECSKVQPWLWEQIRFPEDAKVGGTWDLQKVMTATTYECQGCGVRLPDSNATRFEANRPDRGARFIPTSVSVNPGQIGLHWNSLASMSWGELGVMMLKAKEAADLYGDEEPRRIFKQKRLALPWAEEGGEMVSTAESSDYAMADDWDRVAMISPKAKLHDRSDAPAGSIPMHTMGVDVQRGHFFAAIRKWSKSGHSRLLAFSRLDTWSDVEAFAKAHAVHPALVFVDAGDQATDVYRETAKRGWKCAKGSGNDDFAISTPEGKSIRRFYSERQRILVPGMTQRAVLVVWSNLAGKDLMYGLRARRLFTYARDASPDYVEQMNAEVRIKDRRTGKPQWVLPQGRRDNHAFDCELLNLLAAVRWGIVGREQSENDLQSNPDGGASS